MTPTETVRGARLAEGIVQAVSGYAVPFSWPDRLLG